MTQIFVGNLAYTTSERELRSTFENYGRVSCVRVVLNRQTGNPRGFAFVAMPRWEDADEAITRLNGASLAGRQIVVNEAKSDSKPEHLGKAISFFDRL
jgi:cold-inducible RNA-binding protein